MKALAIEDGCPYKRTVVYATALHNLKNIFNRDKYIHMVDEESPTTRLRKLVGWFSPKSVKCPTANLDNHFLNYTPGLRGYRIYLKAYL